MCGCAAPFENLIKLFSFEICWYFYFLSAFLLHCHKESETYIHYEQLKDAQSLALRHQFILNVCVMANIYFNFCHLNRKQFADRVERKKGFKKCGMRKESARRIYNCVTFLPSEKIWNIVLEHRSAIELCRMLSTCVEKCLYAYLYAVFVMHLLALSRARSPINKRQFCHSHWEHFAFWWWIHTNAISVTITTVESGSMALLCVANWDAVYWQVRAPKVHQSNFWQTSMSRTCTQLSSSFGCHSISIWHWFFLVSSSLFCSLCAL